MKKFKKVFAVLLTLAMVLGMSMTTFAASTDKGSIKITGLAAGDTTTLNMYQFISLGSDGNSWEIAEWAKDYVQLSESGSAYVINNEAELAKSVEGTPITIAVTATEYTYTSVEIGAYLIIATGNKATYTPMVADVAAYGADGLITAKDVNITAKTSGYVTTKEADDTFIARGQSVKFTITTTFPSFPEPNASDNSYKIVDTPEGLDITGVTSVSIGGTTVQNSGYTTSKENGDYIIDLSNQIGSANVNAGKTVIVEYNATVTSENGYSNAANAYRNDTKLGEEDIEVKGFTGSITVRKVEADTETVLKGAEFKVTKDGEDAALYFVEMDDGEYKLALASESGATQTVVATDGTVTVKGLAEGTYHFEETKAPEGYSVATNVMEDVKIGEGNQNVNVSGLDYPNTKLSSLPSTGGIGTTIFTIGGCAIMVIAAALFFASRRKSAK